MTQASTTTEVDEAGQATVVDIFSKAPRKAATADTSFEIDLDEPPEPGTPPVFVDDDPAVKAGRRPIIPPQLRTVAAIKATVRRVGGELAHHALWHLVRVPWYLLLTAFWSVIGAFVLSKRQICWWWFVEQEPLRQHAANTNDPYMHEKLHKTAKDTRLYRGLVLAAEVVALTVAVTVTRVAAPWWLVTVVGCAVVAILAHLGHPKHLPILRSAVVAPRYRKLNSDIVLRAYYAAGLGHPDKPDQQIEFGSNMSRDSLQTGSQVVVRLPYGKTYADAVKAKAAIASGVDVTEQQIYLTKDDTSTRSHTLFVADRDPLAVPAGKTPMLDLKIRDIWRAFFMGYDERGRKVLVDLLWISILIGAQPRKGKTFTARLVALYAALDPYVRIIIADGKKSPDWDKFSLVAHWIIFGTHPNARDDDPVEHLLQALRETKKHIEDANEFLSTLPTSECPDGKLTRDLSRKYPQLRVWLLVLEEFQVYFETDDQDTNKEIAKLLSFIQAVGPSAGVILVSSSQKPSGIGAGDVQRLFNRFRDNHTVRFALKCGNRDVSMAVLGGDAYGEGYDASALPAGKKYRGVGYLYGASDDTPTVRTHLADHEDAEKILIAARAHRERLGLLTGMAAGEEVAREVRDPLADARSVFLPGEAWVSWGQLAARMADQMPEHYAALTADVISAQLRALKVASRNGRDKTLPPDEQVVRGAHLTSIDDAIRNRQEYAHA